MEVGSGPAAGAPLQWSFRATMKRFDPTDPIFAVSRVHRGTHESAITLQRTEWSGTTAKP